MQKQTSWQLMLLLLFFLSLSSCIHDDMGVKSESNTYTNKSLWKEDEKYIKNVMDIYQKNEAKIKKTNGTPFWDYSMTMDYFDERYLMAPVVEGGKVISVLKVPRHGKKVYFIYTNSREDISFFQDLISSNRKKATSNGVTQAGKLVCHTRTESMWYPDSESNPDGPGYWGSHNITECVNEPADYETCLGVVLPDGSCEGGGSDDGGYDYPGGGEIPEDLQKKPCDKIQEIGKNDKTKNLFSILKGKTTSTSVENGYLLTDNGAGIEETEIHGDYSNPQLNFSVDAPIDGIIHSHYQGLLSVFSVADLFALAKVYKKGKIKNVDTFVFGVVTSSGTQYLMVIDDITKFETFANGLFTGDSYSNDALTSYEMMFNSFGIRPNNTVTNNEISFVKYLDHYKTGLKVMKGDSTFNNWSVLQQNDNGTVSAKNCN